jgi:hypothetical protein
MEGFSQKPTASFEIALHKLILYALIKGTRREENNMRSPVLATSILALLLMAGCSDNPTQPDVDSTVDLEYGQEAAVDEGNLKIAFIGPVYDDRCGANEFCNWEGFAEIQLRLTGPDGDTSRINLGMVQTLSETTTGSIDTLGYRILLSGLSPYPGVGTTRVDTSTLGKKALVEVRKPYDPAPAPITITNFPAMNLLVQDYNDIDSIYIDRNVLKMRVWYGGGCQRHYFQLFMSPGTFAESEPVQAYLYLRHFGIPDLCRAYIPQWVQFDLTPVAELYRETYHHNGDITLNIGRCYHSIATPPECPMLRVTFNTTQAMWN